MKKFLFIAITASLTSCNQVFTKEFGGETTIVLPKGERLIIATWKDDNIWYLTEPMDSSYIPNTKILQESSVMGIYEGKVTFVEQK